MVLRGWIRVFQVLARELRRLGIISRIYLLYELEVLPVILCHHLKQNWTISSFLLFVAVVCSEEWPMSLLLLKRLANLFEGTLRIRKGVQRWPLQTSSVAAATAPLLLPQCRTWPPLLWETQSTALPHLHRPPPLSCHRWKSPLCGHGHRRGPPHLEMSSFSICFTFIKCLSKFFL
ncbi:uncharacterized protein [Arachis hypogaea]|uniref:uncharacterized protein isoform X1 n=1 Tax=Arachis hypogaea TaxID=3818 RepID=UPI000DED31C5|nr:uncharacterized protein LOC112726541 isoform X1 [Arachis hypogaea]